MLGNLKGLMTTLAEFFRPVVTAQYPKEHLPVAPRFMGFPVLTWDDKVGEPFCTGCMVCVRYCPTQCMSATMTDNPLFKEGKSKRRKIVGEFEINFGRCIVCGICVDVCNFDAILMSHEHELSVVARNGNRANREQLLKMGQEHQQKSGWKPAAETTEAAKEEASV
ncbi:MAG: NADH-quinone oxidoreductase subunit I [Dehalococcoidia bacterium]|nr:NADH-quinone oxidoreductase subunit I [Dehalococcoidia bacterium]